MSLTTRERKKLVGSQGKDGLPYRPLEGQHSSLSDLSLVAFSQHSVPFHFTSHFSPVTQTSVHSGIFFTFIYLLKGEARDKVS